MQWKDVHLYHVCVKIMNGNNGNVPIPDRLKLDVALDVERSE